jgi:negative regulator of flagellin synthesis FlgM
MKIHHDVTHALKSTDKSSTAKTAASTAATPTSSTSPVDSVSISDASRALQLNGVTNDVPFDTKRVEAIKSAISAGHFKVNPEAVADKVIQSASQLLTNQA